MEHPYRSKPDYAFWSRSVANIHAAEIDPVVSSPFILSPQDKIVTAGSCFAQHIARHLAASGFNYWVTEPAHPLITGKLIEKYNYGVFSARYGNIYTVKQLLQLFYRAFDKFSPQEPAWKAASSEYLDPFRPSIQPGGYYSLEELEIDRAYHLQCVRKAFTELDVFVFTLGLTEAWVAKADGAVFPICPGVQGGEFDPIRYEFVNFGFTEILTDLLEFIQQLRGVNPNAKIILTVSPVPLAATAENKHVLVSTVYSKSVLRAVCGEIEQQVANLVYFPSFEIITSAKTAGHYFHDDFRTVKERGVEHVMRVFFKHLTEKNMASIPTSYDAIIKPTDFTSQMEKSIEVICDEAALDKPL